MNARYKKILLVIILLSIASQFIPVNRSNSSVTAEIEAPQELMTIMRRACFDCHSNETIWPWYSHIAPLSWLIAHDVKEGREHLNFSTWGDYDLKKQAKLKKEIWEEVDEGEMPPLQYYPTHLDARLSEQDKSLFSSWSKSIPE